MRIWTRRFKKETSSIVKQKPKKPKNALTAGTVGAFCGNFGFMLSSLQGIVYNLLHFIPKCRRFVFV